MTCRQKPTRTDKTHRGGPTEADTSRQAKPPKADKSRQIPLQKPTRTDKKKIPALLLTPTQNRFTAVGRNRFVGSTCPKLSVFVGAYPAPTGSRLPTESTANE